MSYPVIQTIKTKFTLVDDEIKYVKLRKTYGRNITYEVTRKDDLGVYYTTGADYPFGVRLEIFGGIHDSFIQANLSAEDFAIQGDVVGSLNFGDIVSMGFGSGYTDGTHTDVTFDGDSTGVRATVVVSGGSVQSCVITDPGTNRVLDTIANGGIFPLTIDDNSGSPSIGVGTTQSVQNTNRTYNDITGNNIYLWFQGVAGRTQEVIVKAYVL